MATTINPIMRDNGFFGIERYGDIRKMEELEEELNNELSDYNYTVKVLRLETYITDNKYLIKVRSMLGTKEDIFKLAISKLEMNYILKKFLKDLKQRNKKMLSIFDENLSGWNNYCDAQKGW